MSMAGVLYSLSHLLYTTFLFSPLWCLSFLSFKRLPSISMERVVFGSIVVASIGVIVGVHYQQRLEKQRMHEGVLRDRERVRAKRLLMREQQRDTP